MAVACMPWRETPEVWAALARHTHMAVHVLCGQRDSICPPGTTLEWLDATLGAAAEVTVLADYGHSLPYEFPLECSELLQQRLGTGQKDGAAERRGTEARAGLARALCTDYRDQR